MARAGFLGPVADTENLLLLQTIKSVMSRTTDYDYIKHTTALGKPYHLSEEDLETLKCKRVRSGYGDYAAQLRLYPRSVTIVAH